MKKKFGIILMLLLFITIICTACSGNGLKEIKSFDDLNSSDVNISQPSDYDLSDPISEKCPLANMEYIDNAQLAFNSVSNGKIDAYFTGMNYYDAAVAEGMADDLTILDEMVTTFYLGLGLSDETPIDNYTQRVNDALSKLKNEGTFDEIKARWFDTEDPEMPELPVAENPEYTLKIVTSGQCKPNSYFSDNKLVGFDVELAYRVAYELNCDVEFETAEYSAMLAGLTTGKYDMVSANLYITAERSESVTFSDPYESMDICAVVRDSSASGKSEGFFESIISSFEKNFIRESRWKMLLSGFGITLLITFFGFVGANIFGAVYCMLRLSNKKWCHAIASVYSAIMQGTPIVVILMILFYVIFGNTNVSGVVIAILGFALDSGVGLGQIFYGGITGVDAGQKEAALALGFTKTQGFFGITFPQAARRNLEAYSSAFISLMKGTSIVGYVAVVDLTRAGNIIQSITYEAFFPLIAVAIVYFVISTILLRLASSLQKKLLKRKGAGKLENTGDKPLKGAKGEEK